MLSVPHWVQCVFYLQCIAVYRQGWHWAPLMTLGAKINSASDPRGWMSGIYCIIFIYLQNWLLNSSRNLVQVKQLRAGKSSNWHAPLLNRNRLQNLVLTVSITLRGILMIYKILAKYEKDFIISEVLTVWIYPTRVMNQTVKCNHGLQSTISTVYCDITISHG